MEPVSIIGGAFLSALFEFPCRRGIEWSFERLSRGKLDPNHNIMRAAAFARWNASLHLLEKAEEAIKDWQRAEGDYQLQATGRWAEGIKAKKALQSKMGKVHKMSVEEMAGDDALSIERIEAAITDLLAAEKNQKAAVEELAARGAVAELLNLGSWDELPPPLEQAFLSPTDGFQAAFAATIGNLLSTNDTRWSPFQKIRQVLHDAEVEIISGFAGHAIGVGAASKCWWCLAADAAFCPRDCFAVINCRATSKIDACITAWRCRWARFRRRHVFY